MIKNDVVLLYDDNFFTTSQASRYMCVCVKVTDGLCVGCFIESSFPASVIMHRVLRVVLGPV